MNVKQLIVHVCPHLDEIVAIWLLRNLGEKVFPGISKAKLVAWKKEDLRANPPEVALSNGSLLVGLGGGMFDDHLRDGQMRRTECAATLVAKHIGISGNPLYMQMLKEVFLADSEADGSLQWLAEEIKNLNRYWAGSIDLEVLYKHVEPFIIVQIERQREFLEAKKLHSERYRSRVCWVTISAADVVDNRQYQHAARAGGAKVIIQRNSNGLTQIFGCEDLDLPSLAMKIRKAELTEMRNGARPTRFLSDDELREKGTLPEVPQWYVDDAFILNGSESFPDVPPSRINFRDLVRLVEKHIAVVAAR